ncbi:MAG: histidine--tRNA ligase [Clostridia bacterium]|nr:histidine--tRNA ligase [Clostridia bacterium]
MIIAPKGTKDVLPSQSKNWQFVEKTAREVAELFNAKEIRTPTFEHTEVFLRGIGETTDIVNKEMYTFMDKGGRSITLKPEGTAGVARAFVENGLYAGALPSKLYYITQCFRYERPQAGRLREFHQFGVEFLGASGADVDAEVIILAKTLLDRLGVKNVSLFINSIGCKNCRKKYSEALKKYMEYNYSGLCDLCKERLNKNPLRVLDCKNPDCKKITADVPVILDYLCDECVEHMSKLEKLLQLAGVEYTVNPKIVRGLDYYTKTVFEFVSDNIGAQGTVCGGGRYDGLITEFGANDVPGVGFAVGIERLLMLLENSGVNLPVNEGVKLYVASMGEKEYQKAFEIATKLREQNVSVEIDHMQRGIKSQFKYADKIGAEFVAVIGSTELEQGVVKLKKMADGTESMIAFDEIGKFIKGE